MLRLRVAALTLLAAVCTLCRAGVIQTTVVDTWRINVGRDPRWASPTFDDSSWRQIPDGKQWDELGIGDLRGDIWARARVSIPPNAGPLALTVHLIGPHEIFVNGKKVGQTGEFPPRAVLYVESQRLYQIPPQPGNSVEVVMHVYLWPGLNRIGYLPGKTFVGPAPAVNAVHELLVRRDLDDEIASYILIVLYSVLAGGLVLLFFVQRQQTEYLWLAIAVVFAVIGGVLDDMATLTGPNASWLTPVGATCSVASAICMLEFVFRFLREPMPVWLRVYQIALPLQILRSYSAMQGWISLSDSNVIALFLYMPYWFVTPGVVIWRYFRGNKEAGLLAVPLLLMFVIDMLNSLHWVLWRLRLRNTVNAFVPDVHIGMVDVQPDRLTHFLFFLAIGAVILYRFQRIRSEEERVRAELEAARSMQEVMVPSSVTVDGFKIETAYVPAQEVGGDFFQIFPCEGNSVLVIIGDVSGKGLRAAMLVSLIVGLLRGAAAKTRRPAEVLNEVNRLLAGQIDGRFATCCCALIEASGRMLISNAGHLPPYCEGREISTPGNVPLGITAEAVYEESEFQIPVNGRVLFLSDGVVEARAGSGELYGFDRTRSLSVQPAAEVARTAQSFGQEDDITVVAIQPAFA